MSVRTKSRRKITVGGKMYVWYITINAESGGNMLNIASMDKSLVLTVPLGFKHGYLISKGRSFEGKETDGIWARYILPFDVPEIITPAFVAAVIKAAITENALEMTDYKHIRELNSEMKEDLWMLDIWGY